MATTKRRGGALLAVLWLSAALAAIAFSLATTIRGETERTSTEVDGLRSYYLATGAIQRAILYLLWAPNYPLPNGMLRYYTPGMPYLQFSFPSGDAVVEIIPESAKFDINAMRPEDLFRLLSNLGVPPDRARDITLAVVDWRTPAPAPTEFDQFYLSLTPSFPSRHASIEEIEELLLVRGMTPEIFYGTYEPNPQADAGAPGLIPRGGLNDCISVFGSTGQFDVNSAPPAVLATIGLSPETIGMIMQRRQTMPFRNVDMPALLQSLGPAGARLRLGGNSIFTLRATARLRLADGQYSDLKRTVAAMVKYMPAGFDAPYHILRWYDTAWSH
ncbi:MAG: general secretion pathway protein GspK [Acidobacteria bacterium]|nr:general secretion pathway protein GspK [Acidobacteriota bacterium]